MKNQFINKMFRQFMFPSILAAVGLAVANIADSLVVGMSTGSVGLATIGITAPIYMIYAVFYVGLGVGGSIEFARLAGAGKNKEALQIFNKTMMASVIIGLFFSVTGLFFTRQVLWILGTVPGDGVLYHLSYEYAHVLLLSAPVFFINTPLFIFIRNDDNPKLSGFGFAVGNITDVLLNFVLVLGMKVGVAGSVWATVIGQCVSIGIFSIHFIRKKHIIRFAPVFPRLRQTMRILKNGLSTSNQYISLFVFIMLANHILSEKMGDSGVAVFDIVLNVSYVGLLFFNAASDALQPLSSTFHGERNVEAQHKVYQLAMVSGVILGILLLAGIMIGAGSICRLFGVKDSGELKLGILAVRIYCVGAVFGGINMLMTVYCQSVENYRKAYLISLLRGTVLLLLFTMVCSLLRVELFFMLFPLTEISCLLIVSILDRYAFIQSREELPGEDRIYSLMLGKNEKNLAEVIEKIEEFCERFGATAKQNYYVTVTVEEICSAILDNANIGKNDDLYISLTIISELNGDFRLCIRDNALEFNPFDLKAKKVEEEDDDETLGGLGILIVRSKAKNFYYRHYLNFNTLNILV